ncbi:MAG: hypothetical protein OEL76_18530 [Siculibacillus sp.]|nr:hypothetical protein [Siculibacillus sp.]
MDPASLALSLVTASAASTADLVAIRLMRRNADAAANVVELIDAANENMDRIRAAVAPGIGGALDVTA